MLDADLKNCTKGDLLKTLATPTSDKTRTSYITLPSVMDRTVVDSREKIADALIGSPISKNELLRNLGLFLLPQDLKRFLFFDSLYRQFINVPGNIIEFGCRWGQNLAILQSLRAIYEPHNFHRKIIGFDTFQGFPGVTEKDGTAGVIAEGGYGVSEGYESFLEGLLSLKETQSPISSVKKFQIIKGDAASTFERYLEEHPETIVSFAYFDMDLYDPTMRCLKLLMKHVTKGSVIGFDELNFPNFPGETLAFQEIIGAKNVRLQRNSVAHTECFFVYE